MRRTRMAVVVALALGGCGGAHTEEWRTPKTEASISETEDRGAQGTGGETPVQFFMDGGTGFGPGMGDAGGPGQSPLGPDAGTSFSAPDAGFAPPSFGRDGGGVVF